MNVYVEKGRGRERVAIWSVSRAIIHKGELSLRVTAHAVPKWEPVTREGGEPR